MAGYGSRFSKAGYLQPKPLIPVFGYPMIEWVIRNLTPSRPHRFIFICQSAHILEFKLNELLLKLAPNSIILETNKVTEGAACTVLLGGHFINNQNPIMIANCDQFIDQNIDVYLNAIDEKKADGMIMTMKATDPKWSYIKTDDSNLVCEVAEKKVISNEATVGIYNFSHGEDYVSSANSMIKKNLRVNNEFYVAPTYNELIQARKKVLHFNIGSVEDKMHGLGTPEDLNVFIKTNKNKLLFR